jgi:hypothetical protein
MKTYFVIAVFSLLLVSSISFADTFRCPNGDLVATGDQIGEIAVKCDKPTLITQRDEPQKTEKGKVQYIKVEEWTYNKGPNDFIYTLLFRNGVLAEISSGGYGN